MLINQRHPPTHPDPSRRRRPFGVPRRYGISSLIAVTAGCAVLFSVMNCLGAPPTLMVVIAGYFALVAIGQAVLFGGQKPRQASMLVGSVAFFLGQLSFFMLVFRGSLALALTGGGSWVLIAALLIGSACGYLAGALVAGIFLILDRLQHRRDPPATDPPPPALPMRAEIVDDSTDPPSPGRAEGSGSHGRNSLIGFDQ